MFKKNLNAQQKCHPPPLRLPQNAITSEKVLRHHRSKRRGGIGVQALSPPSSYMCILFHRIIKGILQIQNNLSRNLMRDTSHDPSQEYSAMAG